MRLLTNISIITGAGSSIGIATALSWAREGAEIAVFDPNVTLPVDGGLLAYRI
jgi:NAD(P)-dependent dehydrogenase (short-subunit alcohol dehydrogenase family)